MEITPVPSTLIPSPPQAKSGDHLQVWGQPWNLRGVLMKLHLYNDANEDLTTETMPRANPGTEV